MNKILAWGPFGWTLRLFHVVHAYGSDVNYLAAELDRQKKEITNALRFIKRATKVHADVNLTDGNVLDTTVILCGRYRGRDMVQTFKLPPGDMADVVEKMKYMGRAATIGAIDVPVGLDVVVKRELSK